MYKGAAYIITQYVVAIKINKKKNQCVHTYARLLGFHFFFLVLFL